MRRHRNMRRSNSRLLASFRRLPAPSLFVIFLIVVPLSILFVGTAEPQDRKAPATAAQGRQDERKLSGAAAARTFPDLAKSYTDSVAHTLKQFCLECHSTAQKEGELDLERFLSLKEVRRDVQAWQKVAEMLDNGEMPPKESPQLDAARRSALRGWVADYLRAEAIAMAGDPGPVLLRRLTNAEYTYTLRDLTGIDELTPAKEFPVDSAAGEGFTNTGNALVMSPALLTKYFDAAKEVASHLVPTPDGLRFSRFQTRRDWTNESLSLIREFYARYAAESPGTQVNLQGIVFDTNSGGRLAVEKYVAALWAERQALRRGDRSLREVAGNHGLNEKYLTLLWDALESAGERSQLLERVRQRWQAVPPSENGKASKGDGEGKGEDDPLRDLISEIVQWQKSLWRFTSVGHIGKVGGPTAWQEPVVPLQARQELRIKMPSQPASDEITLFLVTGDAADGPQGDVAIWDRPRFVVAGQPDLTLRELREVARNLQAQRERIVGGTERALTAAAEAMSAADGFDLPSLARRHGLSEDLLAPWLDFVGVGTGSSVRIESHLTQKHTSGAGYDFIKSWGPAETPNVAANSSDQHVRIPGNMKPHSVAMHPSPTLNIIAGWRSPITAQVGIAAKVQHAHPECGNGVTWVLEVRRGNTRQQLAAGVSHGAQVISIGPFENTPIRNGDLVSLIIGPRDGNHGCDLTAVDLTIVAGERKWDLAGDVSPDILAGNPHADSQGNPDVWHFFTEPVAGATGQVIPPGSLLAKWQAGTAEARVELARQLQQLVLSRDPLPADSPDGILRRQITSLGGPLLSHLRRRSSTGERDNKTKQSGSDPMAEFGLPPEIFGTIPKSTDRSASDDTLPAATGINIDSICVRAPSIIELRLPADLVAGAEFVAACGLHPQFGREGSVQLQVATSRPERAPELVPALASESNVGGAWTSNNRRLVLASPILTEEGTAARRRFAAAFDEFRALFPIALCYTKIVPVDEVVTLTLFYREDDALRRLMLSDSESEQLDRLWDELHFVSNDALTLVDAFQQLMEYATQDADPKVFEPMRQPILDRASAHRKRLVEAEPRQLDAVIRLAGRAFRRPLSEREERELRTLYADLRRQELVHDDALRLTLARVLVAPAFLYRVEQPAAGDQATAVSDFELASRLSYFTWSSLPDDELLHVAAEGRLRDPDELVRQLHRLLRDPKSRRLAIEFACQWLQIYNFDQLDEKSERHFPSFAGLRSAMYEESIQFCANLFQNDRSILDLLDADYVFVNEALASHYGLEGVQGIGWQRVDGVRAKGRGGILGMAATLAKQSGASRTSPILRGNWISEVLLGEKLPKPPKGVPPLPDDEAATEGLTVRQLVERHSSEPKCIVCHQRIDPLGFALEEFDAIGKRREKDLGDRPIDATTRLMDGTPLEGAQGLRGYLSQTRRSAFVRQFSRKLLGYALGRAVQLSDEPLLEEMERKLADNDYRVVPLLEMIVSSSQFRQIRGRAATQTD